KSVAVPSTASTPFDVFGVLSSGTLALETVDWTNDTTRATALTTQDGVLVKSGDTTRRYLGTGRTTASTGQTEDSDLNRYLWNFYNRVHKRMHLSAGSNNYNTNGAREWGGVTNRVNFVVGYID